jgi:nucleoside-diphosphate-sugar epimerase
MTSLVTGASGFLGGRLTQVLVEQGESVRILARRRSDLRHLDGLKIEVAWGSLGDSESIRQAVAGCSVIYHCAGAATDWADWSTYHAANVVGVQNIVDAAARVEMLERLVHISTSDVYGYPVQACDETHPLTDVGLPYNRSKIMGERIVWEASRGGLPVTILRPASIYGPRSKDFVFAIAALIMKSQMILANGGRSRAGLVYVDNAVDGIIRAAHTPHAQGQAYNIRDEGDETWREYVDTLAQTLGKPAPRLSVPSGLAFVLARVFERTYRTLRLKGKPLFTRHAVLILCRDQGYSIAKAQRELGFTSTIAFEEGVRRSTDWFLAAATPRVDR